MLVLNAPDFRKVISYWSFHRIFLTFFNYLKKNTLFQFGMQTFISESAAQGSDFFGRRLINFFRQASDQIFSTGV